MDARAAMDQSTSMDGYLNPALGAVCLNRRGGQSPNRAAMAPAALEAELLRRLAARDDRQAACFEELALLFACQQDKLGELERAAQSRRASTLGSGADGDGPRQDAQGGGGRHSNDGQGERDEQQNEKLQHEKQQKQPGTQKLEGNSSAATPPAAGSSTLTTKESGKTIAVFPKTSFELQRELLRVRNEGSALKASLTDTRERLRQERAQHFRVKDELKATQELLQATQNELRALRSQHKHTEEKYLDISARNHDLEVRIVDEKRKVAETLNAMNEMIQSQQTRGGSHKGATFDVSAIMTPGGADESTANEDASSPPRGAQQSAKAWTSNVGVQLPTDWRVVAEASGVSVVSLAYNDDGTILVAGGSDGILRLWSPQFYNELSRSESVRQPILCVDMKSRYILGTCDRSCYVWQVEGPGSPPVLLHRLSGGHTGSVVAGRLTPDCRYAATGGRKIKIWDVATGDVVRTVDCMSKCLALDVNEQGSLLVSGHADKGVRLWDMRTGQRAGVVTSLHTNPLTSVSFSSQGNIVTAGMDNRLAILDQAKLGEEPPRYLSDREYRANQWWCKACVSPGIFTSGSLLVAAGSKAGSLFIWDLDSLSKIYTEQAHAQPITCVVWSPTGSQLASVDASGAIVCWNATGR